MSLKVLFSGSRFIFWALAPLLILSRSFSRLTPTLRLRCTWLC